MSDFIIQENDQVIFIPAFGAAVVTVQPGIMKATGKTTQGGMKICVVGDESQLSVPGCSYMTPSYPTPGVGTIKIEKLAGNQQAKKTKSGGKKVILKGGMLKAKFEVQTPAQDPKPVASGGSPIPDSTPSYSGQGSFVTTNIKFKGS
ncbi:MAG TPA: hypothetical protein VK151_06815 [Fluviicola sp.]|nr:hypothetical protein [Fluviicola sp.]